jgi:hypothetical protein
VTTPDADVARSLADAWPRPAARPTPLWWSVLLTRTRPSAEGPWVLVPYGPGWAVGAVDRGSFAAYAVLEDADEPWGLRCTCAPPPAARGRRTPPTRQPCWSGGAARRRASRPGRRRAQVSPAGQARIR